MRLNDYPLVVFVLSFLGLSICSWVGATILRRRRPLDDDNRKDFDVVLAGTLTLLGLILGFSFSMAINRYDQRKNLEEEEANAIGTEMLRAELLPAADASKIKALLKDYLRSGSNSSRFGMQRSTGRSTSASPGCSRNSGPRCRRPPSRSRRRFRARRRGHERRAEFAGVFAGGVVEPHPARAAWWLMVLIAVCANMLMGYGVRDYKSECLLLLILPLVVSITFMLIADIDSPRGGFIRVVPQNLISLQDGMRAP